MFFYLLIPITVNDDIRLNDDHRQVWQAFVNGVLDDFDGHLFYGIVVLFFHKKIQHSCHRFTGLVTIGGYSSVYIYVLDWLRSNTVYNHRGNILFGS